MPSLCITTGLHPQAQVEAMKPFFWGAPSICTVPHNLIIALPSHAQVEAMKHAFGARLALGDPGTLERPHADIKVAMDALLDPYFAESLRRMVESGSSVLDVHKYGGKLNPLEASQSGATPDDRGTTHLSVAVPKGDADGCTGMQLNTACSGDEI
eukprot:scaffold45931_cov22-Tisochrysis_lutea.AAC.1